MRNVAAEHPLGLRNNLLHLLHHIRSRFGVYSESSGRNLEVKVLRSALPFLPAGISAPSVSPSIAQLRGCLPESGGRDTAPDSTQGRRRAAPASGPDQAMLVMHELYEDPASATVATVERAADPRKQTGPRRNAQ